MWTAFADWRRRGADPTAAFAREVKFRATLPDVPSDPLLANAIINRCIDEVDTGIEHSIEDGFSLVFAGVPGAGGAAQFHRTVTEHRHRQASPSEFAFGQISHSGLQFAGSSQVLSPMRPARNGRPPQFLL